MIALLKVSEIEAGYGGLAVVHQVSLVVHEGEAIGLVGPNGAGKSTVLRSIAGLMRPTRGSIHFEGQPIVGLPPEQIVRRGISLVPEGRRIFPEMTVRENLLVARGARLDAGYGRSVLKRFPALERLLDLSAGGLSGGEQQQLAIARALLTEPRLLLLDEPSLGLAPQLVSRLFQILEELRDFGVTMLVIEQNVRRTLSFADRAYFMRNGRITLTGTRDELQNRRDLADAYLGGGTR